MEDITVANYMHATRGCKDFQTKSLGEYHDLYIQSDMLLLVDIFENFRNKYRKIYIVDSINILSAPRL